MSSSTARRTSIVGLGALGLALVAGPIAAAAPANAQVPLPLPTESPLDVLVDAVEPVTEQIPVPSPSPTVPPLPEAPPLPAPLPAPVPLPGGSTAPAAPGTQPQGQTPANQPQAGAGAPAAQPMAAAGPQASAPLFSDARTLRAFSFGSGTAVLDAFSAAIGMGSVGGFGTASGLRFDALAPEIAPLLGSLPPAAVEAPQIAPQEIELAAGLGAADGPIPAGLPGMTVAAAALAIAAAAAAHLAAASRRRDIFS